MSSCHTGILVQIFLFFYLSITVLSLIYIKDITLSNQVKKVGNGSSVFSGPVTVLDFEQKTDVASLGQFL